MPVGYLCIDRLTVSGLPVPAAGPAAAARSPWGRPRPADCACLCPRSPGWPAEPPSAPDTAAAALARPHP